MEEFTVDPWAPNMAGLTGVPPEFIGVGRVRGLGKVPRRVGLPAKVLRRGVGATLHPFASYTQATADLANQVSAVIVAGDTYLSNGDTAAALSAYQAAGNAGASNVGPEIDLSGLPSVTQPLTQEAWSYNGHLQATTDAKVAQTLAKEMEVLYQLAIARGQGQLNAEASGLAAEIPGGPDTTTLVNALGVAAAGGVALAVAVLWLESRKPARGRR
jgi:hypothetical protein